MGRRSRARPRVSPSTCSRTQRKRHIASVRRRHEPARHRSPKSCGKHCYQKDIKVLRVCCPHGKTRCCWKPKSSNHCICAAKWTAKHAGRLEIITNDVRRHRTRRRNQIASAAARATCESGRSPGDIDESRILVTSNIGGRDCRGSHPVAGCCESKFVMGVSSSGSGSPRGITRNAAEREKMDMAIASGSAE